MPSVLITGPASEPVTLAEAKAHLRLETALDDTYVSSLIAAARQHAEEVCWRGFVTQTWELVERCFPDGERIELPRGSLASITSVKYIDADGAEQTMPSTDYAADTANVPGGVVLGYGKNWPSPRDQFDAVKVRYVVGWSVGSVPVPVKQAILLLVSQMYEHRTPEVAGTIVSAIQFAFEALLAPYRLVEA